MAIQQPEALEQHLNQLEFLQLTYVGGSDYKYGVDANGNNVLIRLKREKAKLSVQGNDDDYADRKKFSVYKPYYRSITDKIAGYIVGEPVTRDENIPENAFVAETMKEVINYGIPLGEYWVGVDAPQIDTPPVSKLQEMEMATTPYFTMVSPLNVVDYEYDENGELLRFAYSETYSRKPSMFEKEVIYVQYWEWTQTEVRVYEAEEGQQPDETPKEVYTNSFGVVPFAHFNPSIPVDDMAEIAKHLYNLGSLYDEEIVKAVFSAWLISGVHQDEVLQKNPETGEVNGDPKAGSMIFAGDEKSAVHSISGQPEVPQNILNAIYADIDELYRLVGLQNTYKNQVESGEAKRLDFQNLNALLVSIAEEAQRVENYLLPLVGNYENSQWPKKFDVKSFAEELAEYLEEMKIQYLPTSYRKKRAADMINKINQDEDNTAYVNDIKEAPLLDKEALSGYMMIEGNLKDDKKAEIIGVGSDNYKPDEITPVNLTGDMLNG